MAESDKTRTIHIPATPTGQRDANLDDVSTQVLSDTSNRAVGLLTVVDGPGKGEIRPVFAGTNQLGRSADNRIPLDFGDATISRLQHAVIACDATSRTFRMFDGGKQNPIHVNGERLTGDRGIVHGDTITIGLTTLQLSVT